MHPATKALDNAFLSIAEQGSVEPFAVEGITFAFAAEPEMPGAGGTLSATLGPDEPNFVRATVESKLKPGFTAKRFQDAGRRLFNKLRDERERAEPVKGLRAFATMAGKTKCKAWMKAGEEARLEQRMTRMTPEDVEKWFALLSDL